jgi:hypothetical protein
MQQAGASAQEEVQIEVEEGRKQYLDLQADLPQAQEEGQRCSRPLPSPGPWSGAVGTEECAPWQPMLLSRVFKSERIVLSADRPHRPQLQGLPHGEDKPFLLQAPARFQWQRGHLGSWTSGWFPCQHCSPTAAAMALDLAETYLDPRCGARRQSVPVLGRLQHRLHRVRHGSVRR